MYERHWRLQRAPFSHDRNPASFFASRSHHSALLKLRYLIDHRRGLGLLVGASGSGKSRLLEAVLPESSATTSPVAMVVYPQMSSVELLSYIAHKLSGESVAAPTESMDLVLQRLEAVLRMLTSSGRPPVIVIDDAHVIADRSVLQSLQLLLNFQQCEGTDFTLILAGQPELVGVVQRLPQLDDRVAMPCVKSDIARVANDHRASGVQRSPEFQVGAGLSNMERARGVRQPEFDGRALGARAIQFEQRRAARQ